MRRRAPASSEGLRERLEAWLVTRAGEVLERLDDEPAAPGGHEERARALGAWDRRIDELRAGEPARFANWELRGELPPGAMRMGQPYWYVVDAEGALWLDDGDEPLDAAQGRGLESPSTTEIGAATRQRPAPRITGG